MSATGLRLAREAMTSAGLDPVAIEAFSRAYQRLEVGDNGLIPEHTIEPLDMPALADTPIQHRTSVDALRRTALIKLNGGLGTSMGLDRAKSLLEAREGLSFLDIIARQVLAARQRYEARLPVTFLHSFRTTDDSLTALSAYPALAIPGIPLEVMQNKVPKLRADDLTPVSWPQNPALEWCPPGHGDLYSVLQATGLVTTLLEQGFTQLFVSNSDNLGAVADPQVAGWFAASGAPFAIESVRRTPNDRKGGHFARRRSDGRIILRETAQTLPDDQAALRDLERHRFCSTNNLWIDLEALAGKLAESGGVIDLPLICNRKHVDPADTTSTLVLQLESAMGAAIELFDGARTIEVSRNRFIPVKTTDDLLVLRSDCYRLDERAQLQQMIPALPTVSLAPVYRNISCFEERFRHGSPSMALATSLVVDGDWWFEEGVSVEGDAHLDSTGGTVPARSTVRTVQK